MKKTEAIKLKEMAIDVAQRFSRTDREFNYDNETFELLDNITPLSDDVAIVYYRKKPSGKLAMFIFYHINMGGGQWRYFVPTDSHFLGFSQLLEYKRTVERNNFGLNFKD